MVFLVVFFYNMKNCQNNKPKSKREGRNNMNETFFYIIIILLIVLLKYSNANQLNVNLKIITDGTLKVIFIFGF